MCIRDSVQVVRHVHEHLVDGVNHNIFRGNILEINLIDAGAVFLSLIHISYISNVTIQIVANAQQNREGYILVLIELTHRTGRRCV